MMIGRSPQSNIWFPLLLFAFLLLLSEYSMGDGVKGARVSGLGGSGVALSGFWAVLNNQAGLAGYRSVTIGVSAANHFMLRETTRAALALAFPVRDQVIAMSYQQAGHALYREMSAGLALARHFGNRVDAGLQLDYRAVSLAGEYGRSAGVSFQAGIRVKITELLVLAIHTSNPLALQLKKAEGEGPEGHWSLGLLYYFGSNVIISLEVEKEFLLKPVVRGALEYELHPLVIIRTGFSSLPAQAGSAGMSTASVFSFGYGLATGKFRLDMGAGIHNMAGFSPAVSVQYVIDKRK